MRQLPPPSGSPTLPISHTSSHESPHWTLISPRIPRATTSITHSRAQSRSSTGAAHHRHPPQPESPRKKNQRRIGRLSQTSHGTGARFSRRISGSWPAFVLLRRQCRSSGEGGAAHAHTDEREASVTLSIFSLPGAEFYY